MKRLMIGLVVMALCLGMTGIAMAEDSDSHSVTVTVNPINEIAIHGNYGKDITLTISTATAGSPPDDATNDTCSLSWTTNAPSSQKKKITAQLDSDYSEGITLTVVVTINSGNGSSKGTITLSSTSHEVVTGICSENVTDNTLLYTASATTAVSPTTETRSITYTLTDW